MGRGDELVGGGGIWLAGEGGSEYYFFLSYIHQMKKTLHLFLLGHMREPLAKIILYEAREREGEREGGRGGKEGGREREAKGFLLFGTLVMHTEAVGRLN